MSQFNVVDSQALKVKGSRDHVFLSFELGSFAALRHVPVPSLCSILVCVAFSARVLSPHCSTVDASSMQPLPVTASLNFNLEGSVKCVQSGVGWIFPTGQCLVHETLRRIGWLVFTCLSW